MEVRLKNHAEALIFHRVPKEVGKAPSCRDRSGMEVKMQYTAIYHSPLGEILLAADDEGLTGLWLEGQKYFGAGLPGEPCSPDETPVLKEVRRFLDVYFSGREPDFMPPLHPQGSPFRQEVWEILRQIPYGGTITYGEIARVIAERRGGAKASARAVGGAVGHNPISILIPCHRVIGADGKLTGYAGGLEKKEKLLRLEHEGAFLAGGSRSNVCGSTARM